MVAASLCSLSLTEEERRKITAYVTPTDNTYNNILSLCVLYLIILIYGTENFSVPTPSPPIKGIIRG